MKQARFPLSSIARLFVRYANLTFGGGDAVTAVLHREIVVRRAWIDESRFALCFALSRATPGTNVLAFCVGVGWLMRGFAGALVALLAASVPCALLAVVVTLFFDRWSQGSAGAMAIHGAMAAAVGITIMAGWNIARPHVSRRGWWRPAVFVGAAFGLAMLPSVSPIKVLMLAAAAGAVLPLPKT